MSQISNLALAVTGEDVPADDSPDAVSTIWSGIPLLQPDGWIILPPEDSFNFAVFSNGVAANRAFLRNYSVGFYDYAIQYPPFFNGANTATFPGGFSTFGKFLSWTLDATVTCDDPTDADNYPVMLQTFTAVGSKRHRGNSAPIFGMGSTASCDAIATTTTVRDLTSALSAISIAVVVPVTVDCNERSDADPLKDNTWMFGTTTLTFDFPGT